MVFKLTQIQQSNEIKVHLNVGFNLSGAVDFQLLKLPLQKNKGKFVITLRYQQGFFIPAEFIQIHFNTNAYVT